jgi:hypothetical protein
MSYNYRILSISLDGKETIITENGSSKFLPELSEESAAKLLLEADLSYRSDWPPHEVISDIEGLYKRFWKSRNDLNNFKNSTNHTYIVCTSGISEFFTYLYHDNLYHDKGRNITPIFAYGRYLIMGPHIDDQTNACSACFTLNLLNNLPSLQERWKNWHRIIYPPENHQLLKKHIEVLRALREVEQPWYEPTCTTILDMVCGKLSHEVNILRLCESCETEGQVFHSYFDNPDKITGEFVGAVRYISQVNCRPKSLTVAAAQSNLIPLNELGGGVCYNFESAELKAKFETIERLITSNISSLAVLKKGHDFSRDLIFSKDRYGFYTEKQYRALDFPLSVFNMETDYYWLEGRKLINNEPVWIPADFVSSDLSMFLKNRLSPPTSNGTAVYDSPVKAQNNALIELIERDVVTRCWFKRDLFRIDELQMLPKVKADLSNEGLDLRLLLCGNFAFAPVVVAIIYEADTIMGAVGAGSGSDLFSACESAVFNAGTMFAYREQTNSKSNMIDIIQQEFSSLSNQFFSVNWEGILEHFDPVVLDLSTELLQSHNIYVKRAWSYRAVSFPSTEYPIPLNLWNPVGEELLNLKRERSLF